MVITLNCVICGKEFFKKHWNENTCSPICREERRKIYIKTHEQKNPIIYRKSAKKYYDSHKKEISLRKKKRAEKFKFQVLNHYGSVCACCGEKQLEFLTVDHIHGDGSIQRKTIKTANMWEFLVKNNYPAGFQVLCFNCNFIKNNQDKPFCKVHHPELYESQP